MMQKSSKQRDDTINIAGLSCHLPFGLGPSAFGLTSPPPCPILVDLLIHLDPAVIPSCFSDDTMGGLGVNYSSVSKTVYAILTNPTTVWKKPLDVLEAAAGVPLSLPPIVAVDVAIEMPKALLHARSVKYCCTFDRSQRSALRVDILDLKLSCIIGLHEHERREKQRLEVDLRVEGVDETWDHKAFADKALQFFETSSSGTLESLIHSAGTQFLPDLPTNVNLDITIRKPSALPFATPSISISRFGGEAQQLDPVSGPSRQRDLQSTNPERIFIALGSNIGDRVKNIRTAVKSLEGQGIRVVATGRMYESEPMYVEDQDRFVNSVIEVTTTIKAPDLLRILKRIEKSTGRTKTFRNGPRVVDLDLLYYGSECGTVGEVGGSEDADGVGWLELPHPRVSEREFVLRPLNDIAPHFIDLTTRLPISVLLARHRVTSLAPIIPTSSSIIRLISRPLIMGIFNTTPDSFSDGDVARTDPSLALAAIQQMMTSPCPPDVIDIGGMSTRPNSTPCSEDEEISRVVPLIEAIRTSGMTWANVPISVDTYRAAVALRAIAAGANIINDVRGGREAGMLQIMADAGVPVVLMHSRGDSTTMTTAALQDYGSAGVVAGVRSELKEMVHKAREAGVKDWDIILDPGIGFSKSHSDNLELLRRLPDLNQRELRMYATLIGASRKGFVGKVIGRTGKDEAALRGWGDAVINAWCTLSGGGATDILRVHDVRGATEAVKMAEVLRDGIGA